MSKWPSDYEQLLRAYLPMLPPDAALPANRRLTELGLDSLSTVGLLVELEDKLGVEVPDQALTAETFETAESLWAVLVTLRDLH